MRKSFDAEAYLSWVLAGLAGMLGAVAFTHSAGYFVTFMTGNTERAALGWFRGDPALAISAALLVLAFLTGVVIASFGRRHMWPKRPHGVTVLTTVCLAIATVLDIMLRGWAGREVPLSPVLFITFGVGALNTTFSKNGEVSVPLSYVTGTLVKLGQGIERHISGGEFSDWLGYLLLYVGFVSGAVAGGVISLQVSGSQMLLAATAVSAATAAYSHFHVDRHSVFAAGGDNG
ncbi:YoaK family protein [Mycolicibacterium peregrinum]|uniref:DUF1275 domain-containing protein n=1 Tax=Mycolicibacterium peregrinum TaxID=43304 RepID=A0A4Z0HQ12_MYCPR|nr:YoaK family protein [Mycolicibacterium peregrinum]TGB43076.1 DUF1275 domain-containing protein [Mycolicibacterium peregrinum]TGB44153.1 DUF1275 domain-containing protein [Mycolicibacterium peregrinum]